MFRLTMAVLKVSTSHVTTWSNCFTLAEETLVDVALDLGLPPVLHERNPGDHEVTVRELDAAEITQEELLGHSLQFTVVSINHMTN